MLEIVYMYIPKADNKPQITFGALFYSVLTKMIYSSFFLEYFTTARMTR